MPGHSQGGGHLAGGAALSDQVFTASGSYWQNSPLHKVEFWSRWVVEDSFKKDHYRSLKIINEIKKEMGKEGL